MLSRSTFPPKRIAFWVASVVACLLIVPISMEVALRFGIREVPSYTKKRIKTSFRERQKHSVRVLMVGDSFSKPGVDGGFGELMASYFEKEGIDFVNRSSAGKGPKYYHEQILDFAEAYKPTLIIANYYVGNDLTDTQYNLRGSDSESQQKSLLHRTLSSTYLYEYLKMRAQVRSGIALSKDLERASKGVRSKLLNPWLAVLSESHPNYLIDNLLIESEDSKKAWDINQSLFIDIKEISEKVGAKLVINLFPRSVQVNRSLYEFWKSLGMNTDDRFLNSQKPQDKFMSFCNQYEITCFDLLPEFRKARQEEFYRSNDDHWNDNGNKFATNLVSEFIKQKNLLKPLD